MTGVLLKTETLEWFLMAALYTVITGASKKILRVYTTGVISARQGVNKKTTGAPAMVRRKMRGPAEQKRGGPPYLATLTAPVIMGCMAQ